MQGKGQFDEDAFIGRLDFGRYSDKQVAVTTYGDEVYVHIKDRTRGGRGLSLRGTDFLQLIKNKGKITTLLEQGGKHIAKKRRLEDSFFDDSVPIVVDSDSEVNLEETIKKLRTEANLEETIKKLRKADAKKRQKLETGLKKALKEKKLQRTNSAVSSLSSSDDSTDGEDKENRNEKKKSGEEAEAAQAAVKEAREARKEESDDGDTTPPIKQLTDLKHLSKKHKKKLHYPH